MPQNANVWGSRIKPKVWEIFILDIKFSESIKEE
jgi:hypothetical protein